MPVRPETTHQLEAIHARADARVAALEAVHGSAITCKRGCAACCVDGLTVFEVEAQHIEHHAAGLLANATPHAEGGCAFLDAAGACRIYAHRPYVCRTQGVPLRMLDHDAGVESRDVCTLNLQGQDLVQLASKDLFEIGPFEAELAMLQDRTFGALARRPLRGLFGPRPQKG